MQSDAQLAKLAGEGHERAFEALVRRYRKPLLAYCRRLTSSDSCAEDALQQGLLQAWTAIRTGAEVQDPRAWLYRIVHNVAISSQRRPRPILVEIDDTVSAGGADHEAERRMAAREALEGLAALPEMQRDVLVSTAVDGLSHEEVAHALGLTSGAVRGLVYRARATLRAAAAAVLPGPLIGWSLRSAARGGSPGVAEALAGGGSAGLGVLLVKGGAIAVTAGAIATAGIAVDQDHDRSPRTRDAGGAAAQRPTGLRSGAATLTHDRLVADSTGRAPSRGRGRSSGSDDKGGAAEPGDDSGGQRRSGSGSDQAGEGRGGTRGGPGQSSGDNDGGSRSGTSGSGESSGSSGRGGSSATTVPGSGSSGRGGSGRSSGGSGSGSSGGGPGPSGGSGSGSSSGSGSRSGSRSSGSGGGSTPGGSGSTGGTTETGSGSTPGGPSGSTSGSSSPGGGELTSTAPVTDGSSPGGPPATTTIAAPSSGGADGGPKGSDLSGGGRGPG